MMTGTRLKLLEDLEEMNCILLALIWERFRNGERETIFWTLIFQVKVVMRVVEKEVPTCK